VNCEGRRFRLRYTAYANSTHIVYKYCISQVSDKGLIKKMDGTASKDGVML